MLSYFAFAFLIILLLALGEFTRRNGFRNLKIKRTIKNNKVQIGEEIFVTTTIENKKWLPISFLHLQQDIPSDLTTELNKNEVSLFLSIKWHERIKSTFKLKGEKRGVYLLKTVKLSLGDLFGFSSEVMQIDDYNEIIIYPPIKSIDSFYLVSNNIQGDNIIKRWIYKDPIFTRGIREYNVEDRMKDIHWPSSLKANKLMVKEYDYSSDRELIIILNTQCGAPYFSVTNSDVIESGIELSVSLINSSINMGTPTGFWTNAHILGFRKDLKNMIEPFLNSFTEILELCGRMSSASPREDFASFLSSNLMHFRKNAVYTVISCFFDDESIYMLNKLKNAGMCIKIIDITPDASLPEVNGIEKIILTGGNANESN
ncbi:DUF58 domain-containing protein [Clostridium sp. 'White wine YQ']|uniref:DUF58 domain-containing protein n=1 Tax=Clostridium sp. 'White wine YQ' TaxID=3027474 RepID=UPI00236671BC|nr:DUF58 domain-containing protein [Clostridium sp. 'White wine YQ']MDD7795365.1 DUF58 domain-containing protein [Clostridium sp. 'White wine YQ']